MRCGNQKRKRLWASYWESSREHRCWRVPWLPFGWSARFTSTCVAEPGGAVGSCWPGPLASIAMFAAWRPLWQPIVALLGAESLFLAWWFRLKPSNDRDWDPSMAVLPRAVIAGDAVTIENVRNLEYRSIDDFTPRYEARTYHLSNIKGVDVIFFDWGDGFSGPPRPGLRLRTRRPHLHVDRGANHEGAEILGLSQPVSTAGADLRRRGRTRRHPAAHEIQRTPMGVPLPPQFERRGTDKSCFSIT